MIKKILSHKRFFKLLKESMSSFKKRIIILVFLILMITLINIYLPHLFGRLTSLYTSNKLENTLMLLIISLYVLKLIIQYFVSFYTNYFSGSISLQLKSTLIKQYVQANSIHTSYIKSGDFHQRVFNETGLLQGKLIFGTIHFLKDIVFFILLLINIFLISPLLFFDLIFFSFLLYLFHNKISGKVEHINQERQIENAELSSFFLEILQGKNDIIIFNLLQKVINSVLDITQKIKKQIRLSAIYQGLADVFLEILIIFFIGSVILILLIKSMELPTIITTLGFIIFLLWPLKSINSYLMSLHIVLPSIKRIEQVLEKMETTTFGSRKIIETPRDTSISIKNLSFSYGNQLIFNQSNFYFPKGVFLISGKNGSGKSTLANLISGIVPHDEGEIIIEVQKKSNAIGLVSQTPFLYNDTIAENLMIDELITAKELDEIVQIYRLKEIFKFDLTKNVGENGKNLSGGEKQIISILRGVLKNPSILILDELTNNLPIEVYEVFIKKIVSSRKNKITIIMSHHKIDPVFFDKVIKI
ncbi:ABC transporter transmembrane region [Polaribacter sp. Hel1_85]|nr:ABC transporter transmembrane region [Polaribacter sp. Hel1_85]